MPSPIIFGPWSGAVTSNSAIVKAAVSNDALGRLALSKSSDLANPRFHQPALFSSSDMTILAFHLTDLQPNTQYFYALEINGVLLSDQAGRFRTFPLEDQAASFTFACAGDATNGSDHKVFTAIQEENPLFFLHLGDLHYGNVHSTLVAEYRRKYREVLESKKQTSLYRNVPLAYTWDDHDFCGDNSNGTFEGKTAARIAYQQCVPHYPLVESAAIGASNIPIYQAFTVGRVRFLLTDTRSERSPQDDPDNAQKTMLGEKQKKWLKTELENGKDKYKLVVWVNSVPWITDEEHSNDDQWLGYQTERAEIGGLIQNKNIRNVCMLSADSHLLAIDDGSNNHPPTGAGGFPVFQAAPLDRPNSDKCGPFSHGKHKSHKGQYGLVNISDTGGATIQINWAGKRAGKSESLVSFQFSSPRI